MLTLDVRTGQAVQIGDAACIKIGYKSGARVKIAFATELKVTLIPDGLIPARFTYGVSGEKRPAQPRILPAIS